MDEQTLAFPGTSKPLRLPPRYMKAPIGLVYDQRLLPAAVCTFLRIYSLHWDRRNQPKLTPKHWQQVCGIGKTGFYNHLNALKECGWLIYKINVTGFMEFKFYPNPQSALEDSSPSERTEVLKLINSSNKIKERENLKNKAVRRAEPASRQQRTELIDHPAVKLYWDYMRLVPNFHQQRTLEVQIADLELWRHVLDHWALHGWRANNLDGMLESYRKGGRVACRTCQPNPRGGQDGRSAPDPPVEGAEKPSLEALQAMVSEGMRQQKLNEQQRRQAESQGVAPPGILADRDERPAQASGRSES